jgi:hypothetical protein
MKALTMLVLTSLVLLPALGWAQSAPAPPDASRPPGVSGQAPAAPSPAPAAPSSPAPAPGQPGTAPGTTAPQAQTPSTPVPGDRVPADGQVSGLSPMAVIILGLVVLGLIVAFTVGRRRRDHDVVLDSRVDTRLGPDRPLDTYESEIERERRRRAS